jgi:hypothetical protein
VIANVPGISMDATLRARRNCASPT